MSIDRPNVNRILRGLKDFQRLTVDHVYQRMYEDDDPATRFLIADETGLGKTMVAKGVIARAVDRLWDKVDRIDIVYICANAAIARQNINRLNITGKKDIEMATRMTLLPLYLHNLQGNKLNFVSFTPDTSFNLHSRGGLAYERALMYHILRDAFQLGSRAGPRNLLQGGVKNRDNWNHTLDNFPTGEIDPQLAQAFVQQIRSTPGLLEEFHELCDRFSYYRKRIPAADEQARLQLIGRMRNLLAMSCVKALEPDVVVLDEFQRFRDLLDGDNEVAALARALFEFPDVRVLLLSATPYKMYTLHHEAEDNDHYRDFLRTVSFLLQSQKEERQLEEELQRYRRAVIGFTGDGSALQESKRRIERILRKVMVRTERLSVTNDPSAMIREPDDDRGRLSEADLESFMMLDTVARELGVREPVIEYWKSAPCLLNMMDESGYKLKQKFIDAVKEGSFTDLLLKALDEGQHTLLFWDTIARYQPLSLTHAKMSILIKNALDSGAWQLLWIPPSLPYYRATQGPYSRDELKSYTKSLVFSSWQVVPKSIAILCSYEAERRMIMSWSGGVDYKSLSTKRRGLLRFASSDGHPIGMSVFTLMYPSLTLALRIDPLDLAVALSSSELPSLKQVKDIAKAQMAELIKPIAANYSSSEGPEDERWYWAAPVMLDSHYYKETVSSWLDDGSYRSCLTDESGEEGEGTHLADHIALLIQCFQGRLHLGRMPHDLMDTLADVALASPAVTALRAFLRVLGVPSGCLDTPRLMNLSSPETDNVHIIDMRDTLHLMTAAARVARGFRTLFNLPESTSLIRGLYRQDDQQFWKNALDYCAQGNLQAVMDEYVHVLRESLGLMDSDVATAVYEISEEIQRALGLRTVTLSFDEIRPDVHKRSIEITPQRVRCRFALRFGDGKDEELGVEARSDQVRSAFNSPFRPFILASTSIGQEGLDFHHYCHEIYHWNLPSNPVDMEQREGRINRFKGHIIRRNLAQAYGLARLSGHPCFMRDPWQGLFALAREENRINTELIPFWVYELNDGYYICRRVPALPLSKEERLLEDLRRSLVAYRMVFGQPRQEDVVRLLQGRLKDGVDPRELLKYRIDLSPRPAVAGD